MTVEELTEYGMERLTDTEVERFLSSHHVGVLGLAAEQSPYLIPMSYGYDGGASLYFLYVIGSDSTKAELSDRDTQASFLVFTAETLFIWRSVRLRGSVNSLPDERRGELREGQLPAWRPELLETASESRRTRLYEFRIDDWSGIRHTGLPPGLFERSRMPD